MSRYISVLAFMMLSMQMSYAGNLLEKLVDAAGDAIEEKAGEEIDELSGKYKGKITELVLLERRGKIVVFDVKFEGIKSTDGISIVRETLSGGEALDDFADDPIEVTEKSGTLRLAIKYQPNGDDEDVDDGWGTDVEDADDEIVSDQIRLSLVRDNNPDRKFGTLVFDMSKVWTNSNDPDEPPAEDEDDSISLADSGSNEGEKKEGDAENKKPAPFIKPGTTLKPVVIPKASLVKTKDTKPKKEVRTTRKRSHDENEKLIVLNGNIYDLYKNTNNADWFSSKGKVAINPKRNNKAGFIRTLDKGKLSTGNAAVNLLNTYPEMKKNGIVSGSYPLMKLNKDYHLKSVIGFLHGAKSKDGVQFNVYVEEDTNGKKRERRVFAKRLKPNAYENIDVDLSRFKGKQVKIILKVRAGRDYVQDYAVWVSPKLIAK